MTIVFPDYVRMELPAAIAGSSKNKEIIAEVCYSSSHWEELNEVFQVLPIASIGANWFLYKYGALVHPQWIYALVWNRLNKEEEALEELAASTKFLI